AADRELPLRRQDAIRPAADHPNAEVLMRRECETGAAADDVALEIEIALQRVGRRDLRRPVDAPHRRRLTVALRLADSLANRRLELMTTVRRLERFAIEPLPVHRRAEDDGVHAPVASGAIRPERFVVVPDAEVGPRGQRLLALAAPSEQEFHLRVDAQ